MLLSHYIYISNLFFKPQHGDKEITDEYLEADGSVSNRSSEHNDVEPTHNSITITSDLNTRVNRDSENEDDREAIDNDECWSDITAVFGRIITDGLQSSAWKEREAAVRQTENYLNSQPTEALFSPTVLIAGCRLLTRCTQDKVANVFSSAVPILHILFDASFPFVEDFHCDGMQVDESLEDLMEALILRAGDQGRIRQDVYACIMHLVCHFVVLQDKSHGVVQGPGFVIKRILSLGEGQDTEAPTASDRNAWRTIHVRLELLYNILSQLGLLTESGLTLESVMRFATECLSNPSVQVRQAAINVVVKVAELRAPKMSSLISAEEASILEQRMVDELLSPYVQSLKPVLVKTLYSKVSSALHNIMVPSGVRDKSNTTKEGTQKEVSGNRRTKGQNTQESRFKSKNGPNEAKQLFQAEVEEAGEGELPYAPPVSESLRDQAEPVQQVFGDKVTRCAFSSTWSHRKDALKVITSQVSSRQVSVLNGDSLAAFSVLLQSSLSDKVQHVFAAGLRLLRRICQAVQQVSDGAAEEAWRQVIREACFLVIIRLGDSKPKVRAACKETLGIVVRHPVLGPTFLLNLLLDSAASGDSSSSLPAPTKAVSKPRQAEPGVLTCARLEMIVEQAPHVRWPDGQLRKVGALIIPALQHREQSVRQAARTVLSQLYVQLGDAALTLGGCSEASSPEAQRILRACLVDDALQPQGNSGANQGSSAEVIDDAGTAHRTLTSIEGLQNTIQPADVTSGSLPYADPLSEELASALAEVVDSFGDPLVRCVFSKQWESRSAAFSEALSKLRVATTQTAPKLISTTPILLGYGLQDSVVRVFQAALILLKVFAIEFMPAVLRTLSNLQSSSSGNMINYARDATEGLLEHIVGRLSESKLRGDCESALMALADQATWLGSLRVSRSVLLLPSDMDAATAIPHVLPRCEVTLCLLQHHGISHEATSDVGSGVPLEQALSVVIPAMESRDQSLRNVCNELYASLYVRVPEHERNSLNGRINHLKPEQRSSIAELVLRLQQTVLGDSKSREQPSTEPVKTTEVSRLQVSWTIDPSLLHIIGDKHAAALQNSSAQAKQQALLAIADMLVQGTIPLIFAHGESGKAWEIWCHLLKSSLCDSSVQVNLAGLLLLRIFVERNKVDPNSLSWDAWEAQVVLGSLVKTLVDKTAETHVRVADTSRSSILLLCMQSNVMLSLVVQQLLRPVQIPVVSSNPERASSTLIAHQRAGRVLVARLRCMSAVLAIFRQQTGSGMFKYVSIFIKQYFRISLFSLNINSIFFIDSPFF